MEKCVLVYEDDLEISFLCKTILRKPNRRIEMRMKCDNIISDIEQIHPDVILMDLWIPEMGGEKAVSLMKNNPETRHIPAILFSANPDIEKIGRKVNADGFIKKPFDIAELREIIERNL